MASAFLAPAAEVASDAAAAVQPSGTNVFHLNFRGVPIDDVLDYLSQAGGFIIVKEAQFKGTVDVASNEPLTKEQAVEICNQALKKSGHALVRDYPKGKILKLVDLDSAKTQDLPFMSGRDPKAVEKSSEMVTQLIPVHYASAAQLQNNLRLLLPSSATLTVNESANSLLLVATKTDVRRMLKIIRALDDSVARVSSVKVVPLKHADAKQLASAIQQLFGPQQSTQNSGAPGPGQFAVMPNGRFGPPDGLGMRGPGGDPGAGGPGGGMGAPGGGMGGPDLLGGSQSGGGRSGSSQARVRSANTLADEYSNSLILSADSELVATIANIASQLDRPVAPMTELHVFHLVHADPAELAVRLEQLFPNSSKTDTQRAGEEVRTVGGPPDFGPRGQLGFGGPTGDPQATDGTTVRKTGNVIAVPDPRTSSLLVSAPQPMMAQVTRIIRQLDASGKNEIVRFFQFNNADPATVNQVLRDLFNRNGTARTTSNNRNSMTGENNPLTSRETEQQTTTAPTGFGENGQGNGNVSGMQGR